MRLFSSLIVLSGLSLLASAAPAGGKGQLLSRVLNAKEGSSSVTPEQAAARRAHRRTQASDWGQMVSNAFSGLRPDVNALKLVQGNNGILNDGLLGALIDQVDESHAAMAFDNFKILETMPAFRALAESGSKDPVDIATAQLASLKDLAVSALSTAQEVISEGGPGKLGQAIVDESAGDEELWKAFREGDVNAFTAVQHMFSNKFLGGADLNAMSDNSWLRKLRADFMADPNLFRLIDDKGIQSILANPMVEMLNPTVFSDPDKALGALSHFLPDYTS